jgi:hypothetical protein
MKEKSSTSVEAAFEDSVYGQKDKATTQLCIYTSDS